MWVNPDAETASSRQVVAIATAGPIFSLAVGGITWLLYKFRYNRSPVGLVFLMLAVVGIYSFLGPVTGAAFGGDFNIVLRSIAASKIIQYATSATGLVLLPLFMFFMGKELSRWTPLSFGCAKAVVCTTGAPWLIGTLLVLLVYWPLPGFLIGPTLVGSSFWLFAVFGAAYGFSRTRTADLATSVTLAMTPMRLSFKESRMAFINATGRNRKSGGAQWICGSFNRHPIRTERDAPPFVIPTEA
jgi:hypothetical protein